MRLRFLSRPRLIALLSLIPLPAAAAPRLADKLAEGLAAFDAQRVPSGFLYDRVLPLARIDRYDGAPGAPAITLDEWRQLHHELGRAAVEPLDWPAPSDARGAARARPDVPIAILNVFYDRIRPGALEDGAIRVRGDRLEPAGPEALEHHRVFAVSALRDRVHRGDRVAFRLDPGWYLSNDGSSPRTVEIDLDDGHGFRPARLGDRIVTGYERPGRKRARVRLELANGEVLNGGFAFEIRSLGVPAPHDTLLIDATIPHQGQYASGSAYVYLSDANPILTNPVIVIEGFDLEDTTSWEELYQSLNQQGMVEQLRADGYDAVVLDFTAATVDLQRNAFVIVELIRQVNALIDGTPADLALVGASMGGLVARYALAWMESQAMEHNVRTFISFDSPQRGANIPLGLQHWLAFFADQSAEAQFLLDRIDSPAARQMLVYHHTDPPQSSGQADSLRADFLADLAGVGDYPVGPRKVAIANGSGAGIDQGFAAGDQIIQYEFANLLVQVTGNVWAVPDGTAQLILDGRLGFLLLPPDQVQVTVAGTSPYDNAPGGGRGSMAQMDSTPAPFGDIVALHDDHCFIPTVSAVDLDVAELFYDLTADPDLLTRTPFDAVYFPLANQGHVAITSGNVNWFLDEIRSGATSTPGVAAAPEAWQLYAPSPNPFRASTQVRFRSDRDGVIELTVYDVVGRLVRRLANRRFPAGTHAVDWNGTDDGGRRVPGGAYFCRVARTGEVQATKMIRLD